MVLLANCCVDHDSLLFYAVMPSLVLLCRVCDLSMQTLEAWCSRATIFAEGGFALGYQPSLQSTDNRSTENRSADDRREGDEYFANDVLSGAMDVAMAALVHPSRLVSSIAPVLLQRVINLRHVRKLEHVAERNNVADEFLTRFMTSRDKGTIWTFSQWMLIGKSRRRHFSSETRSSG